MKYRKDAFGWHQLPLDQARTRLERVLAVPFEPREGSVRGSYFKGEARGVDIVVMDNYGSDFPHEPGDDGPQTEPAYPHHRTLVYIETTDPDWWQVNGTLLDNMPGLVRIRTRSWEVPDEHH